MRFLCPSHLFCVSNSSSSLNTLLNFTSYWWPLPAPVNRIHSFRGLPWWLSGKEPACQCRRPGFHPWVRKTPWRRKWQLTPVFFPGKSHAHRSLVDYSPWGCQELDMTEWLNNNSHKHTAAYPPTEENSTGYKRHSEQNWEENQAGLAFSSWYSLLTLSIWKLWLDWILSSCSRCFSSSPWNSFFFISTAPRSAAALRTLPSSSTIRVCKDTTAWGPCEAVLRPDHPVPSARPPHSPQPGPSVLTVYPLTHGVCPGIDHLGEWCRCSHRLFLEAVHFSGHLCVYCVSPWKHHHTPHREQACLRQV